MANYPTNSDYAGIGNKGTGDNPQDNYWGGIWDDIPKNNELEELDATKSLYQTGMHNPFNTGSLLSYILGNMGGNLYGDSPYNEPLGGIEAIGTRRRQNESMRHLQPGMHNPLNRHLFRPPLRP